MDPNQLDPESTRSLLITINTVTHAGLGLKRTTTRSNLTQMRYCRESPVLLLNAWEKFDLLLAEPCDIAVSAPPSTANRHNRKALRADRSPRRVATDLENPQKTRGKQAFRCAPRNCTTSIGPLKNRIRESRQIQHFSRLSRTIIRLPCSNRSRIDR
jgi:hypothetical protein